MPTRRQLLVSSLGAGAGLALGPGCSSRAGADSYDERVTATWHAAAVDLSGDALRRELVRYATLAPSSHNTQCWKFRIEEQAISILPDFSRRCPAVDPDDHHLFVSLGCAAENLAQAARAYGFDGAVTFEAGAQPRLRVSLAAAPVDTGSLIRAIPQRQCTRGDFDGKPLAATELAALQRAAGAEGVQLLLLTQKPQLENVLDYVVRGNSAQMADKAFVTELKSWIRFNAAEAASTGDGLYTAASGNTTAPTWLGRLLFDAFFKAGSENDKYARQLRSSAGIAVFVSAGNDPQHWTAVGRSYQRFALQATAMGIRNAMLNQPVEVSALRPQFASYLKIGALRPDLVVRFGRGALLPRSLRRPVQTVLV